MEKTAHRVHEDGYEWHVVAVHEGGHRLERVTDGRGVRLMKECGYALESVRRVPRNRPASSF